ncbi:MAG: hypothetical protein ACR2IL_05705 [Chitinophagaceae bacterium]
MKNRKLTALVVLALAAMTVSSCATKKKYGCPGHISMAWIFNF